jgi:hypothetical protein
LAPRNENLAAFGPDSLAPLLKLCYKLNHLKKQNWFGGLVVECWGGNLSKDSSILFGNIFIFINYEYSIKHNQFPFFKFLNTRICERDKICHFVI